MRTDDIGYHHKHEGTFRMYRPEGAGDWLLLLLKTPSVFTIDRAEIAVKENSFILFTPDFPQNYRADSKEYIDDWLHFEPDAEEQALLRELDIPLNRPVHLGNVTALSDLIKRMSFEHYSAHDNRKAVVDLYFRILLYKLDEQMHTQYADQVVEDGLYFDQLLWIRVSVFRWPEQDWNSDVFAKELRLSASRFQHLYTSTFGTTMLQDITSGRMQRACKLLETTLLSMEDIAEQCGYASTSHFIRLFRKTIGTTPLQYRKNTQTD